MGPKRPNEVKIKAAAARPPKTQTKPSSPLKKNSNSETASLSLPGTLEFH